MPVARIVTGEYEVIDNGIVTGFKDRPITITIVPDGAILSGEETGLSVVFDFREDGGDPYMESSVLSDDTIELMVYNHRAGGVRMGGVGPPIGPFEPMEIGELGGQELSCIYQVQTRNVDEVEFTLTHLYYTFYLKNDNVAPE